MEPDQSSSRRKRKPLADCTNIVSRSSQSSSSSASVIKSANPSLSTALQRIIDSTRLSESCRDDKSGVSTRSATRKLNEVVTVTNPSSVPPVSSTSTPSRWRNPRLDRGAADLESVEPYSVYARRKTSAKRKEKEKSNSEPVDFPLTAKIPFAVEKIHEVNVSIPKSSKVPRKKKQRQVKTEQDDLKQTLPRDFIEQQRAYFAEIDAFELPEEEATSTDELE